MDRRKFVKNSSATLAAGAMGLWSGKAPAIKKKYTLKFGTAAPDGTPWADILKLVRDDLLLVDGYNKKKFSTKKFRRNFR